MTKMYVGPSLEGVIQIGTVFRGGYPPRVETELKQVPYLEDLMVEAGRIAQAKKELRDPESRLSLLYRRAEKGGREHGV